MTRTRVDLDGTIGRLTHVHTRHCQHETAIGAVFVHGTGRHRLRRLVARDAHGLVRSVLCAYTYACVHVQLTRLLPPAATAAASLAASTNINCV